MKKEGKDLLRPFGSLDVLYYYSIVARPLANFLAGKEIATKTHLPKGKIPFFLRRGSKTKPLYIDELQNVSEKLLELRAKNELAKVKTRLSQTEIKIWQYFVPRKYVELFYATNNEGKGKPIERIFIDIDRGSQMSREQARRVAVMLLEEIENDKSFNKLFPHARFVMWTGNSFHIYLLLEKPIEEKNYETYIAYSKKEPLKSFVGRWAAKINEAMEFEVAGGHEKLPNRIVIDPSGTPSGKLARAPFSLHVTKAEIDGVALPVSEKDIQTASIVKKLESYTPERVVSEINKLAKLLP